VIVDVFLAVYFSIIGVHYSATTIGLKHRDGSSRIHYGSRGSVSWQVRWIFNGFRACILALCIIRLFTPVVDQSIIYLFNFPSIEYMRYLGCFLMLLSLFLVSYVHAYMNDQWHSGIDKQTILKFRLLDSGPYKLCRHPLFSAVMIGMFGFFCALPSLFTLISLIVGVGCLVLQAEQEEKQLLQFSDYRTYQSNSKKWPVRYNTRR